MRTRRLLLLTAILALAGCDRITGKVDQKALDAEAIGYACRISLKAPEDCMKENDTHSPTSLLYGWKEADRDIKEKAIDPTMGKNPPAAPAAETKPAAEKPAEAAATPKPEKAATGEKPAAAAGKPDKGPAEKKAAP